MNPSTLTELHEAVHIVTVVWRWIFISQFVRGWTIQKKNKMEFYGRFVVELYLAA